jgi:hypothetical protein
MADEFRTALTAFLHSWIQPEWLAEHAGGDFEQLYAVSANGNLGRMFRTFHAAHGRYPTYAELCTPGAPTVGIVSDI